MIGLFRERRATLTDIQRMRSQLDELRLKETRLRSLLNEEVTQPALKTEADHALFLLRSSSRFISCVEPFGIGTEFKSSIAKLGEKIKSLHRRVHDSDEPR